MTIGLIIMQWLGVLEEEKQRKTRLAGGETLLARFLVLQGRQASGWWWKGD
jgi:hypothetical protein